MVINKDHDQAHKVRIVFHDAGRNGNVFFRGPVTMITFGKAQYQWHADRKQGWADPHDPPASSQLTGGSDGLYDLPAASLTVLRGQLQTSPRVPPVRPQLPDASPIQMKMRAVF